MKRIVVLFGFFFVASSILAQTTHNVEEIVQTPEKKSEVSEPGETNEKPAQPVEKSANDSKKTRVINIGEESDETKKNPRKGWWRSS